MGLARATSRRIRDIRELAGPPTANERIMARLIRRSLRNHRLGNGEARKAIGFLNREVFPDVIRKLRDRLEAEELRGIATTETTRRAAELGRTIDATLTQGYTNLAGQVATSSAAIAVSESAAVVKAINDMLPAGVNFSVTAPSPHTLSAIVSETPVNGELVRNWFDIQNDRTRTKIVRELNVGMGQGETTDQIIRRIRGTAANDFSDGVLDASRREVETLVRTSTRHTTAVARERVYEENDDLVKGYEWLATLDTKTCPICGPLDGTVYLTEDQAKRRPPAHPNCRCDTSPVLKSWKELGIDLEEAPPGMRASMDGAVPETQTYGKWLKGQPADVQAEVLGVEKANRFRSGRLKIGDFADDKDHILNLKQLDALEARRN